MKIFFLGGIFFCLVLLLLFRTSTYSGDPVKGLRGPAFSDPSKIQEMPEAWKKQPIKYEHSAGDADIVMTLDQQMYPALSPFVHEYAKGHNLKIVVNEGTCGIGSGMLSRKAVDIGTFCCPPDVTDRYPGLRYHTLGIMPITIFVHPDNPIDDITLEQARKIYLGEITRWSELKTSDGKKGPDMPIQPITRLHCKIRPGHWRLLLDSEELFSPNGTDVGAIPDMIAQVAVNPRAIGNDPLSMVYHYKDRGKVKILKINGYNPLELSNLQFLKYPLYHVYSLGIWEGKGVENPEAKKLVDYLMQVVEQQGSKLYLVSASQIKKAGWKFKDRELVGEPK